MAVEVRNEAGLVRALRDGEVVITYGDSLVMVGDLGEIVLFAEVL